MATLRASAPPVTGARAERRGVTLLTVPFATAVALLGVALLFVLTPLPVHVALDAAGASTSLGAPRDIAIQLSDATVRDLVLWGDFAVPTPDGVPLYGPAEIGHLQNARVVLYAVLALAAACGILVLSALARSGDRAQTWRSIGHGGVGLAVGVVATGIVGLVAFGPAFELFHRVFFFGGNWAFDPRTSALVRLYPQEFWVAATALLGGAALAVGLLTWAVARIKATGGAR